MDIDLLSYMLGKKSGGSSAVSGGTVPPNSERGKDGDIYIQYQDYLSPPYDYTHGISAIFRKVNGSWITYTDPEPITAGVHVWTNSTGGFDASMYVQYGYWDTETEQFVTLSDPVTIVYSVAQQGAQDLYGVATLIYTGNWVLTASVELTDGSSVFSPDAQIASWGYGTPKDFILWKPA